MVGVDDVGTGGQTVEEALEVPGPGPGPAVGPAAAGEVALGQDGHPGPVQDGPGGDRGGGHVAPGPVQVGGDGRGAELHAVGGHEVGQPGRGRGPVGAQHHPVAVGQQPPHPLGSGLEVGAGGSRPGRGGHCGGLGRVGRPQHGPDRGPDPGQQPVEARVQAGHPGPVGAPGPGQGGHQVLLVGENLRGPVPDAGGLDHHHRAGGRHQVGQHRGLVGQPRPPRLHAVEELARRQPVPLLAAPGLGGHQAGGPGPGLRTGPQLPARVHLHPLDRGDGALVAHGELGDPVHLVAPEVDPHRGGGGGRVDVDDGAPHRHLPPALDLVLPPVAEGGQLLEEFDGVDHVARAHDDGLGGG